MRRHHNVHSAKVPFDSCASYMSTAKRLCLPTNITVKQNKTKKQNQAFLAVTIIKKNSVKSCLIKFDKDTD